jgi:hypothetical protein
MDANLKNAVYDEKHLRTEKPSLKTEPEITTDSTTANNAQQGQPKGVQEGIKYCRNCGNKLPDTARFCDRCGEKMDY